jgi:sugar-specific transcriptional regulator TrmB
MTTEFGQHKNITATLSKLGLNDLEQKVYLFGTTVPPLPISSIAKHVGTTRPNAYNIIDSLQAKGLCWNLGTQYGRKIKFAPPDRLLELHKEKIKMLQSLEDEIKNLNKSLKDKTYTGAMVQPRIQYFQGTEGVKKLYSLGLTTRDGVIRTAVYEGLYERFGKEYVTDYIRQRCEKKIKSKI